jgi:hypothetical protein
MPNIWSDPNGFLKDYRHSGNINQLNQRPDQDPKNNAGKTEVKSIGAIRRWGTMGKGYR